MNNYFNFNRFVAYNRMWFETNKMKKKYFYLLLWLVGVSCFFVITFLYDLPKTPKEVNIYSTIKNGYVPVLMVAYALFCVRLCTKSTITLYDGNNDNNNSPWEFLVPVSVFERVLTFVLQIQLLSLLLFYAVMFVTLNLSAYVLAHYASQPLELYYPWNFWGYLNAYPSTVVSIPMVLFWLSFFVLFVNLLPILKTKGLAIMVGVIALIIFITYPKIVVLWDYKQLVEMPQWVQSLYFIAPIVFWSLVPFLMKRQEAIASK
ncbi:MAG: hypothetical protein ACRDDZ_06060 [Marinifilaceae bacterium]